MASRQKNIRLPDEGWDLLRELSVYYGSEAECILAGLRALKNNPPYVEGQQAALKDWKATVTRQPAGDLSYVMDE